MSQKELTFCLAKLHFRFKASLERIYLISIANQNGDSLCRFLFERIISQHNIVRNLMRGKMKTFEKGWTFGSLLTGLILLTPQALFALSNFSATMDSTNLNYSFSYSGSPAYLRVYIDSDNNAKTGYSSGGIGIDYLIENNTLYKFSGTSPSNWSFKAVTSSNMVKTSSTVKWQVARSALGSPSTLKVMANTSAGDSSGVVAQSLPSSTPTTWSFCANENATCSFSGTMAVRYGAGSAYVTKTLTGPVACNNATFGDPASGVVKHCDISSASTPAPTPTPEPTPTPTPPTTGNTSSVSFTASNSVIQNPERGFFMTTDCRANPVSVSQLQSYKSQYGHTIFNCLWYLREFKSSPLSQTVLDQLQTQMNNMRTAGFKMILRLVYTNTDINDAPLSVVQGHLDQLAPLFRNNVDVIATVQTGLIGQWGEMQNSSNYGGPSTAADWANRKAVIDKLLSVVPSSRMVEVRMPQMKMQPYGSTPLSAAEAFSGTSRARVGQYNDCFLSSANDWGTYLSSADLSFAQQDSKYVAMSGETCSLSTYNDCSSAVSSMASLHWSLLHEGYNADVIAKWKTQGCFPEIQARLGYRLQLQNATLSTTAHVSGSISVAFNIVNTGFASLYNARPVQLILRNTSTGAVVRLPMNADPRLWLPGSTIAVNQTLTLPSTIPAGTYAMLLAMPDASSSLAARPEYSIQLANTGIWEASTGFNNLKTNLVVSP
jgi:hypothetical protein